MTSIGTRVRERRRTAGMTQSELARRAQVSVAVVRHLESGHRSGCTVATLARLAGALGVGLDALAGGGAGA